MNKDILNPKKILRKGRKIYLKSLAQRAIPKKILNEPIANKRDGITKTALKAIRDAKAFQEVGIKPNEATKITYDIIKKYKQRKKEPNVSVDEHIKTALVGITADATMKDLQQYARNNNLFIKCLWLPSEATNPDSLHQSFYYREFDILKGINGELPTIRYGCQCGFEIISVEKKK